MTTAIAVLVIAAVALIARFATGVFDQSRALPTPAIPERVDPLEIAYLRSGRGDVLRTCLIGLQARGLVAIGPDSVEALRPAAPGETTPLESAILAELATPQKFSSIARAVGPTLTDVLRPAVARLTGESLLASPSARAARTIVHIAGAVLLFCALIASERYVKTLDDRGAGDSPGLVAIVYVLSIIWMVVTARAKRLTDRGQRYLARLTAGFPATSLRERFTTEPIVMPPFVGGGASVDPAFALAAAPLLVGLYGVSALEGTPYDGARKHLQPARPDGSGGCSMPFDGGGSCGCCGSHGGGSCGGSHGGCGGSCGGGCGGGGCGG